MDGTSIFVIVLVAIAAWLIISNDPFADAVRVRVFHAKSVAQRLVDSAIGRAERSKHNAEAKRARVSADLIKVKTYRRMAEERLNTAKAKVAELNTASDNAASVGRQDMVQLAESKLIEAEADVKTYQDEYDKHRKNEQKLEASLADLDKIIAVRARQLTELDSRGRTAQSTKDVNALIAGLGVDGSDDDMKKAFDMMAEQEAEAAVMEEEADKVRAAQHAEAELAQLAHGPVASVSDRVAARMAKFQKADAAAK